MFSVDYFPNPFSIKTLSVLELTGTKIKALLERGAARDLYDVNNLINSNIIKNEDSTLLRKIILFYLLIGSKSEVKIPLSFDKFYNLKYHQIRTTLVPVLKKKENFDFETAKIKVTKYLSELMQLTNSENDFVKQFYSKHYHPELLFDDAETVARIKQHHLAIWKMRSKQTH
jgi:predicted nucleotidyltransferase component of viral defense system